MQHRSTAIDHGYDAITILFGLINPALALRKPGHPLALHRFDEARARLRMWINALNHLKKLLVSVGKQREARRFLI
jgi:hypothetical protein